MSDIVISAENLSKCYLLGHKVSRPEAYSTLRDNIVRGAQNFCRKGLDFLQGRQIIHGDEVEVFWALQNINFEVRHGEVIGIMGRNGAGKSTLLKILSRITDPDRGRVLIRGRVTSLLEVGTGFHPELTGRENIFLNGAILGMTRDEVKSKFDEIVAFAEVEQFLDTPVKRFSSGMYVRLAFAVAAHLEPEILVVDEVLAVGDTEFQKKCLGKMRSISHAGRTVLFVSHQLGSLSELCTSGLLLSRGHATRFSNINDAVQAYIGSSASSNLLQDLKHIDEISLDHRSAGAGHVFYGAPLVVEAKLKNLPVGPVGFTLAIRNREGRRLSFFSTDPNDGIAIPRVQGAKITFKMDFCSYIAGEYYIDVAVTEPRIRNIEEAVGVLKFEVLPAPRGGTEPYGPQHAEYVPPHSWSINEIEQSC